MPAVRPYFSTSLLYHKFPLRASVSKKVPCIGLLAAVRLMPYRRMAGLCRIAGPRLCHVKEPRSGAPAIRAQTMPDRNKRPAPLRAVPQENKAAGLCRAVASAAPSKPAFRQGARRFSSLRPHPPGEPALQSSSRDTLFSDLTALLRADRLHINAFEKCRKGFRFCRPGAADQCRRE